MKYLSNVFQIIIVLQIVFSFVSCNNDSNSDELESVNQSVSPLLKSAIDSGTIKKEYYSEKSSPADKIKISKDLQLENLKPGSILRFGSSDPEFTQVEARINSDTTIDIVYTYRWAMNGNREIIKQQVNTGKYKVSYQPASAVQTDNNYYPLHQNVMILVNNDITRENGYSNIGRSFCIGKSKSKDDTNSSPIIRLYPWQDPKYYPRGNFYNFLSSLELYEIDFVN
jgi:hypothetical protein